MYEHSLSRGLQYAICDILRKLLPVFVATCLKASTDRQYVTHARLRIAGVYGDKTPILRLYL